MMIDDRLRSAAQGVQASATELVVLQEEQALVIRDFAEARDQLADIPP
jgi:hypothetical protein